MFRSSLHCSTAYVTTSYRKPQKKKPNMTTLSLCVKMASPPLKLHNLDSSSDVV